MSGILAFFVLLGWFLWQIIRIELGEKIEPLQGTKRSRVIRTAARYAASAGRHRR